MKTSTKWVIAGVSAIVLYNMLKLTKEKPQLLGSKYRDVSLTESQIESLMRLILNKWLGKYGYSVENLVKETSPLKLSNSTREAYNKALKENNALPLYDYFMQQKKSSELTSCVWDDLIIAVQVLGIPTTGTLLAKIGLYNVTFGNHEIGPFIGESAHQSLQQLHHALEIVKLTNTNVTFLADPNAPEDFIDFLNEVVEGAEVTFLIKRSLE